LSASEVSAIVRSGSASSFATRLQAGPWNTSVRRSPAPNEAMTRVSTSLPSTVSRTGTSLARALPVLVTTAR
jgi:hypothetical protein